MDILDNIIEKPKLAAKHIRVFAALIDLLCLFILANLVAFIFGQSYTNNNTIGFKLEGLPALLFLILGAGLIPVCEGIFGQTLGKRLMRIKVIKINMEDTNVGASLIRHLFDLVDFFLLIGLIVSSINKNKQRIGDLVANTIVVDVL